MIRVYLDWNVVSNLHSSHESVKALHDFLKDEKSRICIPYSEAHLRDIKRGAKKSIGLESSRLDYLSGISNNNYMSYDLSANTVKPYSVHPQEAYAEVGENIFDNLDFIAVLEEIDDDSDLQIGKMIRDFLASIPNPHLNQEIQVPDHPYFHRLAQSISKAPSYLDFIQEVSEFAKTSFTNPESYKEYRESTRTGLAIRPHLLSSTNKPIESIENEVRRLSGEGKFAFKDVIGQMMKDNPRFQPPMADFYFYYIVLEFMGYHSDKINDKNKPDNMFTDIQHAFYGAHCDYFVTQDKKALAKAAQVYQVMEVTTKALTVDGFIDDIKGCYPIRPTFQSVVSSVSETIRSQECLLNHVTPQDGEIIQACAFKTSTMIMNYFNYLECLELKDVIAVSLLHIDTNLSKFIFFDEIKKIVAEFHAMLGLDCAGNGEITQEELDDLSSFKRQWIMESCLFSLAFSKERNGVIGILMRANC